MTLEQIQIELQKLAKNQMTNDNFNEFYKVAKLISLNYQETLKSNTKIVPVKNGNATMYKTTRTLLFDYEMQYLILFGHRFVNMINSSKTKCYIGSDFPTNTFLTPAHYNPDDKTIYYQTDKIFNNLGKSFSSIEEMVFHENRHSQQFKSFDASSITEALKFDPNSLLILKDYLVMINNGKDFYQRNHFKSIMENDADLYASSLISVMINNYFPEQKSDLDIIKQHQNKDLFDNPFEELEEYGLLFGEYSLDDGTKIDRAIMLDKNLKKIISPQLVQQYPILSLIYSNGKMKTYEELMIEKEKSLSQINDEKINTFESPNYNSMTKSKKQQIEDLYEVIIRTDPMLYLEDLLSKKVLPIQEVVEVFKNHPDLYTQYNKEIDELFERKYHTIDKTQMNALKTICSRLNLKVQLKDKNSNINTSLPSQTSVSSPEMDDFKESDLFEDEVFSELYRKYGLATVSEQERQDFIEKYLENMYGKNKEDIDVVEEVESSRRSR